MNNRRLSKPFFRVGKLGAFQVFHILRQLTGIVIGIVFAKSYLPIQDISTYEKLIYISYGLSFFWVSGLIQGMLALFPEQSSDDQKQLYFQAYGLFTGITFLVFVISNVFQQGTIWLFTNQTELDYFFWFTLYMFLNWPTYLLEHFFLLQNKPRRILQFGALAFGGQVLVMTLPLMLGVDFVYCFYGLIGIAAIKHIWLLLFLFQHARIGWNWKAVSSWVKVSIPLILYAFMGGLNQVFDNWLVNYSFGSSKDAFAIFRYGAKELPLTMALANAFSVGMISEVAKDLKTGMRDIKLKSLRLFHFLFPVSIVFVLTSHWIFPWVFEAAFYESALIFNVYLLLIINRLVFPHTLIMGLKDNHVMTIVSIIELVVNILSSLILVHYFGLWGIAMGTMIGYSLEKVLDAGYLYFKYGIKLNQYVPMKWFLVYSTLLMGAFIFSLWLNFGAHIYRIP